MLSLKNREINPSPRTIGSHPDPNKSLCPGMGKAKQRHAGAQSSKTQRKAPSKLPNGHNKKRPGGSSKQSTQISPAIIPFLPTDRILLVGEGDFSFSVSLFKAHGCASLVATSFDDRSTLFSKHPQAEVHIQSLEAEAECKVLYGVDATKLGKVGIKGSGGKDVRKALFDKIVFNFPHVGGLTKDVDRQIRHNQELLLGFMDAAKPLLTPGGAVVVTIFEGEPYQRWDLRGLGRQKGFKVERSFRFQASVYPDYKHARTLGNIDGGRGWKGEDRLARTFMMVPNEVQSAQKAQARSKSKKRKREDTDSESEG